MTDTDTATASSPTAPEPVLILSCYRTGSTLLRYVLDTHPEIYSPPEVFLGQTAFTLAQLSAGLLGKRFDPDHPEALPAATIDWIRSFLQDQLGTAAARKGKRIWCEKTPSNLVPMHLAILRTLFPAARKICLHRHCLDMTQSLVKMMIGLPEVQPFLLASQGHPVTAAINYWCERTKVLLQLEEEEPARCLRLRYEDYVSDPYGGLEPVFRFLGVDWDAGLVEAVFKKEHDRGMQDHYIGFTEKIHSDNVGAGRGVALEGVPAKTLETMDALLRTLGYPARPVPVAPAGERPAGPNGTAVQDMRWFFEKHLPGRIEAEPDLCASINTLYQFIVAGSDGGAWVVDARRGQVSPGRSSAICNIEVSSADLFAIARGALHPWKAAEQGRLRLRGDIRMPELEKLVRLLRHTPANS